MLVRHARLVAAAAVAVVALVPSIWNTAAVTEDAVVFSGHTDLITCASGPIPAVSCPGIPIVGGSGMFDWVSGGSPFPVSCLLDNLTVCGMHMAGNYVNVACGTMVVAGEVDGTFLPAPVNIEMVVVGGYGLLFGSNGTETVSGVVDMVAAPGALPPTCASVFYLTGALTLVD